MKDNNTYHYIGYRVPERRDFFLSEDRMYEAKGFWLNKEYHCFQLAKPPQKEDFAYSAELKNGTTQVAENLKDLIFHVSKNYEPNDLVRVTRHLNKSRSSGIQLVQEEEYLVVSKTWRW